MDMLGAEVARTEGLVEEDAGDLVGLRDLPAVGVAEGAADGASVGSGVGFGVGSGVGFGVRF